MKTTRSRAIVLALVLMLHGLFALLLQQPAPRHAKPQAQSTPGLLVSLHPPAQRSPARAAPARMAALSTARPLHPRPSPSPTVPAAEATEAATPSSTAAPEAPSAAASGAPLPSLLDSEATRRALRMATREPLLSERAAMASDAPERLSSQQRMAQEMARSADGDCLKGDFAGAGLGLLSAPFWLLAEVRGKCRR